MTGERKQKEVRELLAQYDTGAVLYMAPLSSGSASSPWRIDTEKGSYILRKAHTAVNAANEYNIAETLWGTGITSEVLQTKDGERFAAGSDGFYNLQTRIEGEPPEIIDESLMRQSAQLLVRMHKILKEARLHLTTRDRFTLRQLSFNEFQKLSHLAGACDLIVNIDRYMHLEYQNQDCIHGDTGIWNFILTKDGLRIIDFGEARMGSVYSDHAGFLVSALENVSAKEAEMLVRAYIEAAGEAGFAMNVSRLAGFVKLWLLRGMAAAMKFENPQRLIRRSIKNDTLFDSVFENLQG